MDLKDVAKITENIKNLFIFVTLVFITERSVYVSDRDWHSVKNIW